jgi:4-hydroxy-tetrahydrodipicolinate reductase
VTETEIRSDAVSPPRIVIYGVGQYGSLITRMAAERGWPIVAAFNRAGPKVGRDLGDVAGLGRDLGVVIQDNGSGDYESLDADIGVVTHQDLLRFNMDAYRRFMNAGLNVACHGGQSYLPQTNDPDLAAEIEALAIANGVTFTGGGIWDMSRIWSGILTAGPCTAITALHHRSLTDPEGQLLSLTRGSAFNRPPEDFYERGLDRSPVLLAHKAIPELVLRALGYTIARSEASAEPVVYDVPVETHLIPEGRFEAGVCVGVRTRLEVTTGEGVVATASIEQRMFLPGDVEHMVWEVEGTPRNRTCVERLDPAEATAGNLFNRIPDIIAARPGIVPVTELGPLRSSAARWPRIGT